MAYSKAKLKSSSDKASPCFKPFWIGKLFAGNLLRSRCLRTIVRRLLFFEIEIEEGSYNVGRSTHILLERILVSKDYRNNWLTEKREMSVILKRKNEVPITGV
jgi:hypothetical protein